MKSTALTVLSMVAGTGLIAIGIGLAVMPIESQPGCDGWVSGSRTENINTELGTVRYCQAASSVGPTSMVVSWANSSSGANVTIASCAGPIFNPGNYLYNCNIVLSSHDPNGSVSVSVPSGNYAQVSAVNYLQVKANGSTYAKFVSSVPAIGYPVLFGGVVLIGAGAFAWIWDRRKPKLAAALTTPREHDQ